MNNESTQTAQYLSAITKKYTPKTFLTRVSETPVLFTQIDSDKMPKIFSFNSERSFSAKEKTDVASFWRHITGTEAEAAEIAAKFVELKLSTEVKRGTNATVTLDTDGSLLSAIWRLDEKILVTVYRSLGNIFAVHTVTDTHELRERVVSGTIISSFVEAAINSGLPYARVDDFVDLFSERVDFRRDIQPGDTFSIILDQKQGSDGKWLSSGPIKAASLMNAGKLKAVVRHQNKTGQFVNYNEQGQAIGSYFLRYPVQFTRISSVFTNSRFHPVLGIRRPHNGVDFAAPNGTPVRSIADGVVISSGYFGGSGNLVKIQHNSTYSTAYLHLSRISKVIRKGARVSRGQIIGAVGMTGLATGPHLHFSLYQNGNYIDPLRSKMPSIVDERDFAAPQFIQTNLTRMKDELRKFVSIQSPGMLSGQG